MKPNKFNPWFCVSFIFIIAIFAVHPLTAFPQAANITVKVRVDPGAVTTNQPTEILIEAYSAPGSPIANAYVVITAGGGYFLGSKDTTIEGKTDANGIFGSRWKCEECAPAYVFTIEVLKPGFQSWRGEAKVEIAAPTAQNQGNEIFANVNLDPPVASENQLVLITIETFSDQGNPIKNAQVKISTGGGIFTDSGAFTVEGDTNINGIFETPWKCIKCAEEYVFSIEVNKSGLKGWTGEARILSGEQPMPLHKGDINLNASVHPATASQGQNIAIRVEAISNRGDAIPEAEVRISAGGGSFTDSNKNIIEGQTDKDGIFTTAWNCQSCAPAYEFSIEVNKPGFNEGIAHASVTIK